MKKQASVKRPYELETGQLRSLKELPEGINFLFRGKKYRTITHPAYCTGQKNMGLCPVIDLSVGTDKKFKYSLKVRIA